MDMATRVQIVCEDFAFHIGANTLEEGIIQSFTLGKNMCEQKNSREFLATKTELSTFIAIECLPIVQWPLVSKLKSTCRGLEKEEWLPFVMECGGCGGEENMEVLKRGKIHELTKEISEISRTK